MVYLNKVDKISVATSYLFSRCMRCLKVDNQTFDNILNKIQGVSSSAIMQKNYLLAEWRARA